MKKRPNILFVTSDEHDAKAMNHLGYNVATPNFDRFAAESVRFSNAYTQNPICTPTRISFLSGQYCHNHGYYGLCGRKPEPQLPTIFQHFKQYGYSTALIGKSHCPENWVEEQTDVFHDPIGTCVGGVSKKYVQYLKGGGVDEKSIYGGSGKSAGPSPLPFEYLPDGFIVKESIDFMQASIEENEPFLIQVSFPTPHGPLEPAKEFWDLHTEEDIEFPPNFDYDNSLESPLLLEILDMYRKDLWQLGETPVEGDEEATHQLYLEGAIRNGRGYLGNISQVDYAFGQLLDFIHEKEIAEDTIVIYTSDHGDYNREHGLLEKAPGIGHDVIGRVPYYWRYSGHFPEGIVMDELVEASVDISTTICQLAGVENMFTSDGRDISPLLYGNHQEIHKIAVTEFPWSKAVRKGKYRFIYHPKEIYEEVYPDGFGQLYNLEEDPYEMDNLYFRPEYQDLIREIKEDLLEWLITTTHPVTFNHSRLKYEDHEQMYRRYKHIYDLDGKINPDHFRQPGKRKVISQDYSAGDRLWNKWKRLMRI